MTPRRVVITGGGIASPLGNDLETYWAQLLGGQYGIAPITTFDTSAYATRLAACLNPIPRPAGLTELEQKMSSNLSILSVFCAEQAIAQARLDFPAEEIQRSGVIVGSGFLNLYDLEDYNRNFFRGKPSRSPLTIPLNMGNAPASRIAMKYGLKGIVKSVSTACSSGFTAIADSVLLIREGYQEVMIAGGCDLVSSQTILNAWEAMRVLTKEKEIPALACRPFDRDRRGIALGDGAAFFVLETYEHAAQRGATILAEIKGVFQNSDSLDLVKPDSQEESRCIEQTLQNANLDPADIGMIFAHATGTRLNDTTEYESLHAVFKERLKHIPVCGLKAMIGHTMGASGPMALAAALGALESGYFYPIPNLVNLEEGLDLCITTTGQQLISVDNILLNTFAFGGINVCLVISKI
ncbi:MAG: beta-ketoacyl-[acyl-carrier-protein] synthase family protein [Anaerolineae bacterium]|nr:beta-ketoacyl-[acyl-carrier-protein] synthase family protein [Anaerolineae bacterium]